MHLIEATELLSKVIKPTHEIKIIMNKKQIDLSGSPTMKLIKDFDSKYLEPLKQNIKAYELAKKDQGISDKQEKILTDMKYRAIDIEEIIQEFTGLITAHSIFYLTVQEIFERLTSDLGIYSE